MTTNAGPIRVYVINRKDRTCFVLRWVDPATGRRREETTTATRRGDAERAAATKTEELEEEDRNRKKPPPHLWLDLKKRYEDEVLSLQRPRSLESWRTAIKRFEGMVELEAVADIDASLISRYASALHKEGLTLSSIASYLRELRRTLRWFGVILPDYKPPVIRLPRVLKHDAMKGRPITTEEFERMVAATPAVVGEVLAPGWIFLIRGLWFSALRLNEALHLSWDDTSTLHVWGINESRPMLRILAHSEKGRRDRLLPIIPEFADLLWSVPARSRRGRVFRPRLSSGPCTLLVTASRVISDIGEKAGVVVSTSTDGTTKYASAQDLRRGFAARLAPKLHPVQLKELMRHESLETTMRYYVGVNAERTAADVWAALKSKKCAQMGDKRQQAKKPQKRKT